MSRRIDLVGVPSEAGAQNGTSGGPAVLSPYLQSVLVREGFSVTCDNIRNSASAPKLFETMGKPRGEVRYQKKIAGIACLTADRVFTSLCRGDLPVVLGGDHSIAIGSQRAACDPDVLKGRTVGLIWIDAHYDAHTEKTTQSHNANGMPLATILGHGPRAFRPSRWEPNGQKLRRASCQAFRPEHVLHLGAGEADCEPEEKALLTSLGVNMFSASELQQNLMPAFRALEQLFQMVDLVSVSFDLDAVDKRLAPAVHLPSHGGLTAVELFWISGLVAISKKLWCVDIVEYKRANEKYGEDGIGKTARLAGDVLLRLLGKLN